MMSNSHWHQRFHALAATVATWSRDPSTQVGAVIVDPMRRVVSTGYNGPPRGTSDAPVERPIRLLRTIHAEQNAILFAKRDLSGCAIYVTHAPCASCAAHIIQSGLVSVHCPEPSPEFRDRWWLQLRVASEMFQEAGVTLATV